MGPESGDFRFFRHDLMPAQGSLNQIVTELHSLGSYLIRPAAFVSTHREALPVRLLPVCFSARAKGFCRLPSGKTLRQQKRATEIYALVIHLLSGSIPIVKPSQSQFRLQGRNEGGFCSIHYHFFERRSMAKPFCGVCRALTKILWVTRGPVLLTSRHQLFPKRNSKTTGPIPPRSMHWENECSAVGKSRYP